MANGLLDLLMQARESGRGARADLENSINYYIPPELRGLLGLAAEANPVVSMERAGQDAQRLVQPGLSGWERMAAAGDMASNMAGVLAPMAAGRAVGMPAVRAAQEGLLGLSMTPEAAALRQFRVGDEGGIRLSAGGGVDPATARGQEIMGMLTSGRAADITEDMLDLGDPVLNTRLNEYLYSNYDLPMDAASRMARAKEMGFDQQYYKGMYPYDSNTGPVRNYKGVEIERIGEKPVELQTIDRPGDFPTFTRGEDGYRIAGVMGRDPAVANMFASWPESAVFPLQTKHGRTFELDAAGDKAGNTHFFESGKPFRDAMRSGDYDTGVITNTADEGDIAFALRPENIRSTFARFDPRLSHLRNLNAALTAGVPLGLLTMQPEQEQY